jgi:hypothetical protein
MKKWERQKRADFKSFVKFAPESYSQFVEQAKQKINALEERLGITGK